MEAKLAEAAVSNRYKKRADNSQRIFGGYNVIMFGDLYQIPPIPSSDSLALPPAAKKSELAKQVLGLFWSEDSNAINFFKELQVQKRFDDPWYGALLNECRYGNLSDESYNFLHGLPTEHAGSWQQDGTLTCGNAQCEKLPEQWRAKFAEGVLWEDLKKDGM